MAPRKLHPPLVLQPSPSGCGRHVLGRKGKREGILLLSSLFNFTLGRHSFHGLADSLLISKELHRLDGLQIFVQLIDYGDSSGKIKFHDGSLRHACKNSKRLII